MGVTSEYCELVYQVKGLDQGKALEDQLVRQQQKVTGLKTELEVLRSAYERGVTSGQDYRGESDRLTAAIGKEGSALERLETRQTKMAAAMAAARTAQAGTASETYALGDSYEVLGAKMENVFTSASTIRRGKSFFEGIVSDSDAAKAESSMVRFGNAAIDTGNKVVRATGRIDSGMRGSSMALLNFSRATQDFAQGGLAGILNNVEGMLLPLGAGLARLAGPATIAATAGYLLYQNWGLVLKQFGAGHAVPQVTNNLEGLKEKLGEVSEELEKLRKQGWLSGGEFKRYGELEQAKKDLTESVKAREIVDRLKEQRTKNEEATGKAFSEALQESGSKNELAILEKEIGASANPAVKANFTKIVKSIEQGNIEAYDALIDVLKGSKSGQDSKLLDKLQLLRPTDEPKFTDAFEDAAREVKTKNADHAAALSKELTRQGVELERDYIGELADKTREGITKGMGDKLKDILVKTRAAGSKGAKETAYLTDRITNEMERLFPELKAFPEVFASVARELARTVKLSVDETIRELQEAENLTKNEALRRLNQERAEKAEGKTGKLAQDEFTAFAQRQNAQARRFNPMLPAIGPEAAREQGRQMQDQMRQQGVDVQKQVEIGRLINDPVRGRFVPGAMEALGNRGLDQGQAMRLLPQLFAQFQGPHAAGGMEQAVDRIMHGLERAQHDAFQRAQHELGAVPRARRAAPGKPAAAKPPAIGFQAEPIGPAKPAPKPPVPQPPVNPVFQQMRDLDAGKVKARTAAQIREDARQKKAQEMHEALKRGREAPRLPGAAAPPPTVPNARDAVMAERLQRQQQAAKPAPGPQAAAGAAQAAQAAVNLAANGAGLLNQAIHLNGQTLAVVGRVAREQANQRRQMMALNGTLQNLGLSS